MENKKKGITAIIFATILIASVFAVTPTAQAATPEEINNAIVDGVAWLASQQESDGSWPGSGYYDKVALTGLAVLKLEHYAYELGYDSPFDQDYAYHQEVTDGLNYLFLKMIVDDMSLQDHTAGATGTTDDPDSNGNGKGVYAHGHSYPLDVYDTGIVLSAMSVSGTPNRVVNVAGSPVNGWTYAAVAQDMVDWLAWAQSDGHKDFGGGILCGEGGWSYGAIDNSNQGTHSYGPDNSNTGYAVLGLGYAEQYGYTIPQWVKTEHNAYVSCIQDPVNGDATDGGSWYDHHGDGIGVNILKTGNLIFEMKFVGDGPATPRVTDALDYLVRHWGDASGSNQPPGWDGTPAQYQTMFTTMKGLEYMGINTFDSIDWYADFSDKIVAQQNKVPGPNYGSWQSSSGRGTPTIITEWALLTLEKSAPRRSLSLAPISATNPLGTSHTLTATLVDENQNGVPDETITFTVTAGPHTGTSGTDDTDASGEATWSYTGTTAGTDTIVATGAGETSNEALKTWEGPGERGNCCACPPGTCEGCKCKCVQAIDQNDCENNPDLKGIWMPNGCDMTTNVPCDEYTCEGGECIPEFSTIAIPVASILGLLFFFNYRKRKREQ